MHAHLAAYVASKMILSHVCGPKIEMPYRAIKRKAKQRRGEGKRVQQERREKEREREMSTMAPKMFDSTGNR